MLSHSIFFTVTALVFLAGPVRSHEFWIEPSEYQVENGDAIQADLRNGQFFKGSRQAYFSKRTARFELIQDGQITPVTARMGDIPALQTTTERDGLLVVIHQTQPTTLTYRSWDKFQKFADQKDFPDIRARHAARGLPETDFVESYTRYAKSLIGVGSAQGLDSPTDMETEFVALANPYTDDLSSGLPIELLYQGKPRADAQVEVFDRHPDGNVEITLQRTDTDGRAVIPVEPGHEYLLDAVILREALPGSGAVWETLWAALTFEVP